MAEEVSVNNGMPGAQALLQDILFQVCHGSSDRINAGQSNIWEVIPTSLRRIFLHVRRKRRLQLEADVQVGVI